MGIRINFAPSEQFQRCSANYRPIQEVIEYHYSFGEEPSRTNDMSLWDVYENSKYANFTENHMTYFKPTIRTEDIVVDCEMADRKCKSIEKFNYLTRPYLSN